MVFRLSSILAYLYYTLFLLFCIVSSSAFCFFYLTIYVFFVFIVVMITRNRSDGNFVRSRKVKQKLLVSRGARLGPAMRAAGYSVAYAKNPAQFIATKAGQQLLGWIDEETVRIQKAMRRRIGRARYRDLADSLCNLQKLGRLHRGETTEAVGVSLASALKDLDKGDGGV